MLIENMFETNADVSRVFFYVFTAHNGFHSISSESIFTNVEMKSNKQNHIILEQHSKRKSSK